MKKIIYIIIGLGLGFVIYSILNTGESEQDYVSRLSKERAKKDEFMKSSDQSPFVTDPSSFNGLQYFDIDPSLKVNARIETFEQRTIIDIGTSDGKSEKYYKFALAHFKLYDQPIKLLLLKPVRSLNRNFIFTAFSDQTSGDSTYGGGRYLDLSFTNAKYVTIDFNTAYNPYCAYNSTFSCPFPPVENILDIPIKGGEKKYK